MIGLKESNGLKTISKRNLLIFDSTGPSLQFAPMVSYARIHDEKALRRVFKARGQTLV